MKFRHLKKEDLHEAVSLFVNVFMGTPFYHYIENNDEERRMFHTTSFYARLTPLVDCKDTDIALVEDKLAGVALWHPPVEDQLSSGTHEELEKALASFSEGLRKRFFSFLHLLERERDAVIQQPYWSLAPIAVKPELQGKGIAGKMIRSKLAQIDSENLPCFLATQDKVNTVIYSRYGFEIAAETEIAPGIINYTMLRDRQNGKIGQGK
jgi:predicted GNAT family N-acyltransferase